jgi:hypothetical protein
LHNFIILADINALNTNNNEAKKRFIKETKKINQIAIFQIVYEKL